MDEYFAYLDEAGDEGFGKLRTSNSGGQSRWLLMGGIIVSKENDSKLPKWRDEITALMPSKNRKDLHFKNLNHEQRVMATRSLSDKPFGASVICSFKENIQDLKDTKPKAYKIYKQKGHLYNYLVRFLLERLTTACQLKSGKTPCKLNVTFSKRGGTNYTEMRDYLFYLRDGHEKISPVRSINWDVLHPEDIKVENHSNRAGLQIADVVTSATYKALEPNSFLDTEPRYVMNLAQRFVKKDLKRDRSILNEGITFVPKVSLYQTAASERLKNLK